ncbi:MAG: hypothetical protein ACRC5H_04415, partial [Treponemataceae bacterium]
MNIKSFFCTCFFLLILFTSCKEVYQTAEYEVIIDDIPNAQVIIENNKFFTGQRVNVSIFPAPNFKLKENSFIYEFEGRQFPITQGRFTMPSATTYIRAKIISEQEFAFNFTKGSSVSFVNSMRLVVNVQPTDSEINTVPEGFPLKWIPSDSNIIVSDITPVYLDTTGLYLASAVISAPAGTKGTVTALSIDDEISISCEVLSLSNIFETENLSKAQGSLSITGIRNNITNLTELRIPNEIDQSQVYSIATDAFKDLINPSRIKSIILPSTLQEINPRSFSTLDGVKNIFCYTENIPIIDYYIDDLPFSKKSLAAIHVPKDDIPTYEIHWAPYIEYIITFSDNRIFLDKNIENGDFYVATPSAPISARGATEGEAVIILPNPNNQVGEKYRVKNDSVKLYKVDEYNNPEEFPFSILSGNSLTFQMPSFPIFITLEFENISRNVTFVEIASIAQSIVVSYDNDSNPTSRIIEIIGQQGFQVNSITASSGEITQLSYEAEKAFYKYSLRTDSIDESVHIDIVWIGLSYTFILDKNMESWATPKLVVATAIAGQEMPLDIDISVQEKPQSTLEGIYYVDANGNIDENRKYYRVINGAMSSNKIWDINTSNETFRAVWTGDVTTVTLIDSFDESFIGSINARYDNALPKITIPKRTGYVFLGYYIRRVASGSGLPDYYYYDQNGNAYQDGNKSVNWGYYHKGNGDGTDDFYRMDPNNPILYARWTTVTWDGTSQEPPQEKDAQGLYYAIYTPMHFAFLVNHADDERF